jgi:hypothetical protein
MKKIFFLMLCLSGAAYSFQDEVLIAEKINVHRDAITNQERTVTTQLIQSQQAFDEWEEEISELPKFAPTMELDSNLMENKGTFVPMSKSCFSHEVEYLYTHNIRDCVALVAYDSETKLTCLFHVTKVDVLSNNFEDFVSSVFKEKYENLNPKIYLISGSIHKHFFKMIEILTNHGYSISGTNFCPFTIIKTRDNTNHLNKIYFDQNRIQDQQIIPYTQRLSTLPDTDIIIRINDGAIGIHRGAYS